MKSKSLILLAVAVGCGLVAMLGVQKLVSGPKEAPKTTAPVLVATTDIAPGQRLTTENTTFKEMPIEAVPQGAVTKPEEFEERALRYGAVANDVILKAKLTEKGQIGAAVEIPNGMRVVTVKVNQTKTHSGLIRPGDHVDVVLTYKVSNPGRRTVQKTQTILENIKVFATDSITRARDDRANNEINAKNISLLVTPEQGNALMLAESMGQLTMALRGVDDATSTGGVEISESALQRGILGRGEYNRDNRPSDELNQLLEKTQPVAATPPEPKETKRPTWTMTIFEGDQPREEQIEIKENENDEASRPSA